jgi:hypothetical protein
MEAIPPAPDLLGSDHLRSARLGAERFLLFVFDLFARSSARSIRERSLGTTNPATVLVAIVALLDSGGSHALEALSPGRVAPAGIDDESRQSVDEDVSEALTLLLLSST